MARFRALELLGVALSACAWIFTLAATLRSAWLTLSSELLPSESYELGLWETCVVQDVQGALLCRRHDSPLALPRYIKLARVLLCAALCAGLLVLALAIPGLHAVNAPVDGRAKKAAKLCGGALSIACALLVLVPVSYVAHVVARRFFDESLPDVAPRWEFGDALFCGWTAGVLHLMAGAALLASCANLPNRHPPASPDRLQPGPRSEYV
ncbi:putative claudin-24 [Syngnathoides biaculeatus]|uniref:putative claudin-24 n=1 Tax=Syngnathoides biaculeatus TaxID=300417 RepID=UPI002ADDD1E1|nr:putative claudin-24 [Syngnathoides biaculeatus]